MVVLIVLALTVYMAIAYRAFWSIARDTKKIWPSLGFESFDIFMLFVCALLWPLLWPFSKIARWDALREFKPDGFVRWVERRASEKEG